MDLSGHKIIFIHGLATKPPKRDLFRFWKRCLVENIRCSESKFAEILESEPQLFEMAYWANEIPNHIEDNPEELEKPIETVIRLRKEKGDQFHVSNVKDKFFDFWLDKGLDTVDMIANILSVKDDVVKQRLVEMNLYSDDQFTAEKIRKSLEMPLQKALSDCKNIAIIAHSMGSFVAYDVLWRFSHHRSFKSFHDKKINLFVTIGSPLGDPIIQDLMLGKRYGYKKSNGLPTNISNWVNFAALGDIVCHDQTLVDDFQSMKKMNLLQDFRDYRGLFNPYRNRRGKINTHKSYGYLLQPKLAKIILKFLG